MRLVRRSALLTLLTGMRLLVSNAAADATAFKVISIDPSAQMSDLFAAATCRQVCKIHVFVRAKVHHRCAKATSVRRFRLEFHS